VPITLPLKEFDLLEQYLPRTSGRLMTRGQLVEQVWGPGYYAGTRAALR
jgi:two-component system response regulator RegX3